MDVIKENWDLIKETLRKEYELSDISYSTWIIPLTFHQVKDNVVIIVIPSDQAHALNYISSKYRSYFQVTISEMFDHTYDVAFVLEKDIENWEKSNHNPIEEIEYNKHLGKITLNNIVYQLQVEGILDFSKVWKYCKREYLANAVKETLFFFF